MDVDPNASELDQLPIFDGENRLLQLYSIDFELKPLILWTFRVNRYLWEPWRHWSEHGFMAKSWNTAGISSKMVSLGSTQKGDLLEITICKPDWVPNRTLGWSFIYNRQEFNESRGDCHRINYSLFVFSCEIVFPGQIAQVQSHQRRDPGSHLPRRTIRPGRPSSPKFWEFKTQLANWESKFFGFSYQILLTVDVVLQVKSLQAILMAWKFQAVDFRPRNKKNLS